MATLKDVAKLACVDVSTVSRALNGTAYVHADTKARILKAVEELSYQPNLLAQGLRQGKRNTIGVVVPHLHLTVFAELTQGIEEYARTKGYATLICNTNDDPELEKQSLNRLRNGFVDGIIIAGTGENKTILKDIKNSNIVLTQIMRKQLSDANSVTVDYETNASDAVKYFAKNGCQNIGLINGSMKLSPYRDRYKGYHKTIKALKLKETTAEFNKDYNSIDYGYRCTMALLDKNPQLDAIIAAVDAQGLGVIRALKERNIKIPDQVKVISLTGQAIGAMLETAMTAMEIPAKEIGIKAATLTIEEIQASKDTIKTAKHLVYGSALVERESS